VQNAQDDGVGDLLDGQNWPQALLNQLITQPPPRNASQLKKKEASCTSEIGRIFHLYVLLYFKLNVMKINEKF